MHLDWFITVLELDGVRNSLDLCAVFLNLDYVNWMAIAGGSLSVRHFLSSINRFYG